MFFSLLFQEEYNEYKEFRKEKKKKLVDLLIVAAIFVSFCNTGQVIVAHGKALVQYLNRAPQI